METLVLNCQKDFDLCLALTKEYLEKDRCAIIPSETVYGIVALENSFTAKEEIFKIKQRTSSKPLSYVFSSIDAVFKWLPLKLGEEEYQLVSHFWPGALTVLFKHPIKGKVGVRVSAHPFVLALSKELGPLRLTSANISGLPNIFRQSDVIQQFLFHISLIVIGGETKYDKPSSILDLTQDVPKLLREGALSFLELQQYLPTLKGS